MRKEISQIVVRDDALRDTRKNENRVVRVGQTGRFALTLSMRTFEKKRQSGQFALPLSKKLTRRVATP
jgi:hypothetical protein